MRSPALSAQVTVDCDNRCHQRAIRHEIRSSDWVSESSLLLSFVNYTADTGIYFSTTSPAGPRLAPSCGNSTNPSAVTSSYFPNRRGKFNPTMKGGSNQDVRSPTCGMPKPVIFSDMVRSVSLNPFRSRRSWYSRSEIMPLRDLRASLIEVLML